MGSQWPGDPPYCPGCERHPSAHAPECVVERLRSLLSIAIEAIAAEDQRAADCFRQRMNEIMDGAMADHTDNDGPDRRDIACTWGAPPDCACWVCDRETAREQHDIRTDPPAAAPREDVEPDPDGDSTRDSTGGVDCVMAPAEPAPEEPPWPTPWQVAEVWQREAGSAMAREDEERARADAAEARVAALEMERDAERAARKEAERQLAALAERCGDSCASEIVALRERAETAERERDAVRAEAAAEREARERAEQTIRVCRNSLALAYPMSAKVRDDAIETAIRRMDGCLTFARRNINNAAPGECGKFHDTDCAWPLMHSGACSPLGFGDALMVCDHAGARHAEEVAALRSDLERVTEERAHAKKQWDAEVVIVREMLDGLGLSTNSEHYQAMRRILDLRNAERERDAERAELATLKRVHAKVVHEDANVVRSLTDQRDEAREWARMLLWQHVSHEVRTSILVTRRLPAWLDPEVK